MDMMQMYFVTNVKWNNLLFEGLNIHNKGELVGACFVTFFITILFEGMKQFKLYLANKLKENPLSQCPDSQHPDSGEPSSASVRDEIILLSSLKFPVSARQIRIRKTVLHILNTLCHMVNFFYGYLLMLLVMTYSVWLTIAVVVGSGVGYFICGALSSKLQPQLKPSVSTNADSGGGCHPSTSENRHL